MIMNTTFSGSSQIFKLHSHLVENKCSTNRWGLTYIEADQTPRMILMYYIKFVAFVKTLMSGHCHLLAAGQLSTCSFLDWKGILSETPRSNTIRDQTPRLILMDYIKFVAFV